MDSKINDFATLTKDLIDAINQKPESSFENKLGLKWENKAAIFRVDQLVNKLGVPLRYDPNSGGIALWEMVDPLFRAIYNSSQGDKNTSVYSRLMIKDEKIPHLVPIPHTDWFYSSMYMDIPDNKVKDVLDLTESVSYDTMKKEITARCHFEGANLVTLFLSKQIANGHKSLAHAQQEYTILIPQLAKESQTGKGLVGNPGKWYQALTKYTFNTK